MDQLRSEHPRLYTMELDGMIHKLVDKQLATGVTPLASAEDFIQKWSYALDVDANEFIERGPFSDGHSHQQLMFNADTGLHKFTNVYYMQTADGLPVYGSRLSVLVRNVEGFPAVSATTDFRNVWGFTAPKRLLTTEFSAQNAAVIRLGRGATTSTPELMVYAGTAEVPHAPTAALVFVATYGGHWDYENYRKLELVVDAKSGDVLHETNLILDAVTGIVSGMATESSGADVCDPESVVGMPYAKVTGDGNTVYANANGSYSLPASGAVTVVSRLEGRWFNVNNISGADAQLSTSSSDGSVVNFVHSAANNNEQYRAQVNAYLQSNVVRDYTLLHAPSFPTIGTQTNWPVNTGVNGTCNAFYDYSSINFYNAGGGCSNTAFSVIVHHEYGHHLVAEAGSGQGAYGEGMGDVMGVLITGDNQLARGFFSNDCVNGIRNADNNYQYPCSGEIHDCGQLISGCVWDIIIEMEASYPITGHAIVSVLAINSIMMHSGSGINPSIAVDWLTLDDNDGDLSNGTPHWNEIYAGFDLHNMVDLPEPQALSIEYPSGRPELLDPNSETYVPINVVAVSSDPQDGTGILHYNDGSSWMQDSLYPAELSDYAAIFPVFECGASVDWYISFESVDSDYVVSPAGAPSTTWTAMSFSGSEVVFEDDFETNQGWTVSSGASTGNWVRVVPTGGGDRCDAPTDADGSGKCFVTGNGSDEDVDGGTTILYSPIMDASNSPIISYSRWYNNGADCNGADPNNDLFYVYISDDGGSSWINLETVGPVFQSNGGWFFVEFDLSEIAGFIPSSDFQIRFDCGDLGSGSIIEAGVDGVSLDRGYCDEVDCPEDINGDNEVDITDLLVVIGAWGDTGGPADINGDNIVDVTDLLAIVAAFGPCS